MNILQKIQQMYNVLPLKERKVAKYILEESNAIQNITITNLAKKTKTSSATITRFGKRLGCDSFVDLKIKINTASRDLPKAGYEDIFEDVYSFYHKVIDNTVEMIDKEEIRKVVQFIRSAGRVYICGLGSSGLTAIEMSQRFIRMGLNATGLNESHMMIITGAITKPSDIVIGISNSGNTLELISTLKKAKENGSKIITFTSFEKNKMVELSDINIPVYNSLFVSNQYFVNSQFSLMYVMDIISMMLLEDTKMHENMEKTIHTVNKEFF